MSESIGGKRHALRSLFCSLGLALLSVGATGAEPKDASMPTRAHNERILTQLPHADLADFDAVTRGLVRASSDDIVDAKGSVVWSMKAYEFLASESAPDTVNPSLWRMARLNAHAGLYEVTDRIYQVRGFDLANMSIIEGARGLIVIDPLTRTETAHAALDMYRRARSAKPVLAVIYSHSHLDHFGGVRGVVDESDVRSGKVHIYAPAGFLREAVSENVYAGNAMLRRTHYQVGTALPRGSRGQVDTGIGKASEGGGTIGLIAPTDVLKGPYQTLYIDGVEIEFQLTPGTEAPAEMNMYFPQMHALCMAENATRTIHNLLTPRGTEVRDAKAWSRYLDESLVRYGDRAEVLFAQPTGLPGAASGFARCSPTNATCMHS